MSGEDWSRGSRGQHRERLSTSLQLVHAHQHPGPEPPVDNFLREQREETDKKSEKGGEEKSFIQKYWHYFLIGFIVYTLMGAFVKPAGGEEGGGSE